MDKTTQVVVGKDKATTGAYFRYCVTLSNQAKLEKHQLLSMGSNLTSTDLRYVLHKFPVRDNWPRDN